MPIEEATVSIDDRGFQFGDGIYEVVRSYNGRLWALERHLIRLQRSMEEIGIQGLSIAEVRNRVEETNRRSGLSDALVYFQVTRGVAPRLHTYSAEMPPTFVITVRDHPRCADSNWGVGVGVVTMPESRWLRRDIKSTNLLPNILAKQRAKERGAYEAVFVEDGHVTEGAGTNVFIVRGGIIQTAPVGTHILHGITRQLVLEIASDHNLPVREEFFSLEDLQTADEVFLTGTSAEVMSVVRVDERPVRNGKMGPVTSRLMGIYTDRIVRQSDDVGQ